MERSSIPVQFEELKSSGNLPSPTGVGMRILELTQTDDYSAEDMAEAIMSDPSLTGRILQLANSASVAGNEAVTTVSGAIMRLGGATVRSIALAFSLVSEREAGACRPFDYERYWSLSLARAVGAQELAKRTGVSKPEEAYIAGLLAEVGMLALASVHSTRYGQILIASQGKSLGALRQAEQDEFDIDHATVAECMLAEWGLPEVFGVAIGEFCRRRRFEPDRAEIASVADIVRFSDSMGSALLLGETTPARRLTEIGDQLEILRDVLDVDDDGGRDVTPWCDLLDAVSLVETDTPDLMNGEEYAYAASLGFPEVGPDGSFVPGHVFRCLTSLMDWRIGGFDSGSHDSPGLFNASCAAAMETFCDPGAANSVAPLGGLLSFTGSGSLLVNDNALVASNVPDFFGVFVQADDRGAPIMSPIGGNLCLRGTFERMNTIVAASGQQATLPLDFSDASLVENSTQAGVTEYYQFFHRDTLYPGGGNWTTALAVTWAP